MLDQVPTLDVSRDLSIRVHNSLPTDWPSVTDTNCVECHVFQTREFLESWLATAGKMLDVRTYFVEVTDRSHARVMLLPLSITLRHGEATLGFVDAGLSDYNMPVLYPTTIVWTATSASSLWEAIVAVLPPVDIVVLDKLDQAAGRLVNPLCLIADQPNDENSHGRDLTVPLEEIETRAKRIKRGWRMLEKIGKVGFIVAQTAEDRRRIFERAIEQKRRRFDDTQVVGFEHYPERLAYFERATDVFAEAGVLQLCAMTVGDEIVATSWSLGMNNRSYVIMIGFEAGKWAKHSCGRILNYMQMRWLVDNGFTYIDYGVGDEAWKLDPRDTHIGLRKLVEVKSMRGRAMTSLRAIKQVIRANPGWKALRPIKFAIQKRLVRRP